MIFVKWYFSSSLPADDILTKLIDKEKIIPILDCYVQMLLDTFIVSMDFTKMILYIFMVSYFHTSLSVVK